MRETLSGLFNRESRYIFIPKLYGNARYKCDNLPAKFTRNTISYMRYFLLYFLETSSSSVL